jgi:hypothetical protein
VTPRYIETGVGLETTPSTIFVLIGFLDEYSGRLIAEHDDRVEQFYESEKEGAEIFKVFLNKLVVERALTTNIETEISGGGHITYRSRELTELINSYYTHGPSHISYLLEDQETGELRTARTAEVSKAIIAAGTKEEKLSFLIGAYLRYGLRDENSHLFRFTNAEHKVHLVEDLLRDRGATDIRFTHENPGYIPHVFTLHFKPNTEIAVWLAQAETIRASILFGT